MKDYMTIYKEWLENPYFDEATKEELRAIEGDENEIKERFYMDLEFGTAGLRGIIGAGINRMNIYTVRRATQGLANYIIKQGGAAKGVAIAFDSRHMSPEFAEEAALTLAANGIKAYRFETLRPTPELSFAVRELGCIAGINLLGSGYEPMLISTMAPGGFMIFGLTLGVANIIMKSIEKKKKAKEAA